MRRPLRYSRRLAKWTLDCCPWDFPEFKRWFCLWCWTGCNSSTSNTCLTNIMMCQFPKHCCAILTGFSMICSNIDETQCVRAPQCRSGCWYSVPQVDKQRMSTQDQHLQQTVAQEIDAPFHKMQKALRVGDIVHVTRKSCRKLCWRMGVVWTQLTGVWLTWRARCWSGGMKTCTAGSRI